MGGRWGVDGGWMGVIWGGCESVWVGRWVGVGVGEWGAIISILLL